MQYNIAVLVALAGAASAYFQPDTVTNPGPTGNAIKTPNREVVPAGKPYQITWTPSTPGKVSILLLQGPANNVKYLATIVDEVDNSGSYTWNVDPNLAPRDSEYAVEIVAQDRTYQYSSQIGISNDNPNRAVSSASASASFGSVETAPPSSAAEGTAVCGALDECHTKTGTHSAKASHTKSAAAVTGATGTSNVTSPVLTPTAPLSVPTSLSTVAQPNGPVTQTSIAVVGATQGSGSGAAPQSSALSTALAMPNARLSGAAALVAGLLGFLAL